ncbi:type IV secretion system protein VirB3 [Entomobacter blattae]|uniref:Type IV secretory pathway, VirB3-like protein n=1 Tax=Entomobacter blattae TaxID=2762277 RepID=A0A7H1NP47_9PROT|nr:VirB3 family type IV secretion system protein [Entomobacter blattae]QNT77557.1 Type IV secretory pathway, VirB3-like protein [Entomobacter blattae]QNT78467.1 Type IV secretory pathway, VirB3-like protein [Entomobacter blattae]
MPHSHMLLKGITRLPTFFGVPRDIAIGILMVSACLFMLIHIWALVIFAVLFGTAYALSKHDDRIFRVLFLFLKTKLFNSWKNPFHRLWRGTSYAPAPYGSPYLPYRKTKTGESSS